MVDIVISEFMDAPAVRGLQDAYAVLYDSGLWQRPDELAQTLAGVRALIVRNRTQVTADIIAAGAALKVIGRLGVGLDNIDLAAAKSRGIAVCPATGGNTASVAEYVIAAALILLRGAYSANPAMLAGEWPRERLMGREAEGKTMGLIGFGAIGQAVAARARGLGMRAVATDAYLPAEDPAWIMTDGGKHSLDAVLAKADIVSLHVPLTAQTRGLIGKEALGKMREHAILINTARGGIVDETAVVAALTAGHLGGAALDVFESEPLTFAAAARFQGVPNLILTPHVAGVTQDANARVSAMTAENVRRVLGDGDE